MIGLADLLTFVAIIEEGIEQADATTILRIPLHPVKHCTTKKVNSFE